MLVSVIRSVVLIGALCCSNALSFRFPGRLKTSRVCMVQTDTGASQGSKIKEVAKVGRRRFLRKVASPVSESPDDLLIKKIDRKTPKHARTKLSDINMAEMEETEESVEIEEEEEDEPQSIEVFRPPERYSKTFVCVADILNDEMRSKRSDLFTPHMQWARRSVLSQHLEPFEHQNNQSGMYYTTDKVLVKNDYTLLTEDCTAPATQLLFVRSDNVSNVHEYLSFEPLAAHQALSPWKVFEFVLEQNSSSRFLDNEEEEQHKLDEIFDNDLMSGFLLLSLCNNITASNSVDNTKTTTISESKVEETNDMRELLDNSFRYHAKAARMEFVKPEDRPKETDAYLPLYDEAARIVTFGRLYHTDPPATTITPTHTTANTSPFATSSTATATVTAITSIKATHTNTGSTINTPSSNTFPNTHSANTHSTNTHHTNTDPTASYPYMNPYLTHDDIEYPEPGVLAGQLVFFNALSRADAIRYLKRDPVAASGLLNNQITNNNEQGKRTGMFDRMTLSAANLQDVSGLHHYTPRDYVSKFQFDTVHFMDPEDLLLQNETYVRSYTDFIDTNSTKDIDLLPPLPNLPNHYTMNANLLKQLVVYNLSFRYNRLKFDPILTDIYSDEFGYGTHDAEDRNRDSSGTSRSENDLLTARERRKRGGFTHPSSGVIDVESTEESTGEVINWEEELSKLDEHLE